MAPLVLNETAVGLLLTGDVPGAHRILERLVKSERSNPEIWFNLGSALRKLSRRDEALAAFEKVLALEPRNIAALLEKGSIQEDRGSTRTAAVTYRTALQMIPPGYSTPQWMDQPLRHARGGRAQQSSSRNFCRGRTWRDQGEIWRRAARPFRPMCRHTSSKAASVPAATNLHVFPGTARD